MATWLDELSAGKVAAAYYMYGELFLRDQALAKLRQVVLGDDPHGMLQEVFEGKEANVRTVLAALRTVPMFGGRRLVLIKAAHELAADQLNAFIPYLEQPAPQAVLVMVAEKAELRTKFFEALKRKGVLTGFEALREHKAAAWVGEHARRVGVSLAPGAAERIALAVGAEMSQLASAIEQLGLYVGDQAAVTVDDVEEVLAQTRERSIFELTAAVGRGQRREALLVLHRLLQAREPALRVLTMLARHVRQLWAARELSAVGTSQAKLAAELGIAPFFVGDVLAQARRFDERRLAKMHQALVETDAMLKMSKLEGAIVLERLVLRLT